MSEKISDSPLGIPPPDEGGRKTVMIRSEHQYFEPFSSDEAEYLAVLAGVVGTLMGLAAASSVLIPLGICVIVLGALIPILWPPEEPMLVWESIAVQVGALIDEKITQLAISDAQREGEAQREKCLILKESVSDWLWSKDQGNVPDSTHVQNQYSSMQLNYLANMSRLAVDNNYNSAFLAIYANAGMNYLALLHDIYPYADDMKLGGPVPTPFIGKDHVLREIQKAIDRLTDIAINLYRRGLEKIISASKLSNNDGKINWSTYNAYRTLSTTTALDIVAIYPYFDPKLYSAPVSPKYLNRQILVFTDPQDQVDQSYAISSIENFEALVNKRQPVRALEKLKFESGWREFQVTVPESVLPIPGIFDGLVKISSDQYSIDGRATLTEFPPSRLTLFDVTPSREEEVSGIYEMYGLAGHFPTGVLPGFPPTLPITTLGTLSLGYFTNETDMRGTIVEKVFFTQTEVFERRPFEVFFQNALLVPGRPPRTSHANKVASIQIIDAYKGIPDVAFISKWRHQSVGRDMLPLEDHLPRPGFRTPIEQFHAIKAATSIDQFNLRIIDGPGFTGGDLVEIPPTESIQFELRRDDNAIKWFAGRYNVRIWFYRSAYEMLVDIRTNSYGGIALSRLFGTIPAQSATIETRPKYSDLVSFDFTGTLLLLRSMEAYELTFLNASVDKNIILDRIELIFESAASDPITAD